MGQEQTRLNKYIAECGICSRREADRLIDCGRVSVNGKTAGMGVKVSIADEVIVNGNAVRPRDTKIVLAYYKPVGVTCTEKDKFARKTIVEAVAYPVRVTYAGRLDKDSEGLMILTNDGDLINQMMRGANCHEKEYIVKVNKSITSDFIQEMQHGVYLKELKQTTRECSVEEIGKLTFRIVLTQGLNRQIRRMCQTLGYEAKSIKRVRIMNIELGDLKNNAYRELTKTEQQTLYEMVGRK